MSDTKRLGEAGANSTPNRHVLPDRTIKPASVERVIVWTMRHGTLHRAVLHLTR